MHDYALSVAFLWDPEIAEIRGNSRSVLELRNGRNAMMEQKPEET